MDDLAALKAGHFYSSTGPQIEDVRLQPDGTLTVRCSPTEPIFLVGKGSKARRVWGDGITEAEFDLSNLDSLWCRVIVRDEDGERAWTIPIWLA